MDLSAAFGPLLILVTSLSFLERIPYILWEEWDMKRLGGFLFGNGSVVALARVTVCVVVGRCANLTNGTPPLSARV